MHKSFNKLLNSLYNFNKLEKAIDFLLCFPYSTVVSPYLFIEVCDIFHRKHEVFYESAYFFIRNIYKLSPIVQERYNIIFNFFGVFINFSFSSKASIEVISVGMERSNGIPMEIFRLLFDPTSI